MANQSKLSAGPAALDLGRQCKVMVVSKGVKWRGKAFSRKKSSYKELQVSCQACCVPSVAAICAGLDAASAPSLQAASIAEML